MSFDEEKLDIEEHLEKSIGALRRDFQRIRTGRANPSMLDHVMVEAYGATCPLNQVAGVSVPEPTQLLIKPWDKNVLKDIERAIIKCDLGMPPQNDGEVIRLNVPPLSEERRKELASHAKEACEKCKVAMRNIRRDGIKSIEAKGKDENLPEDLVHQGTEEVTELLKQYEAQADGMLKEKVEDLTSM